VLQIRNRKSQRLISIPTHLCIKSSYVRLRCYPDASVRKWALTVSGWLDLHCVKHWARDWTLWPPNGNEKERHLGQFSVPVCTGIVRARLWTRGSKGVIGLKLSGNNADWGRLRRTGTECQSDGENCVMRNTTVCTLHQMSLGRLNQGG
jgi:hypothetical protein